MTATASFGSWLLVLAAAAAPVPSVAPASAPVPASAAAEALSYAALMRRMAARDPADMDLGHPPWTLWHDWQARARTATTWAFPPLDGRAGTGLLPAVARLDFTLLGNHWIPRLQVACEGPPDECAAFAEAMAALQVQLLATRERQWQAMLAPLQAEHAAGRLSLRDYQARRDALLPSTDYPPR